MKAVLGRTPPFFLEPSKDSFGGAVRIKLQGGAPPCLAFAWFFLALSCSPAHLSSHEYSRGIAHGTRCPFERAFTSREPHQGHSRDKPPQDPTRGKSLPYIIEKMNDRHPLHARKGQVIVKPRSGSQGRLALARHRRPHDESPKHTFLFKQISSIMWKTATPSAPHCLTERRKLTVLTKT